MRINAVLPIQGSQYSLSGVEADLDVGESELVFDFPDESWRLSGTPDGFLAFSVRGFRLGLVHSSVIPLVRACGVESHTLWHLPSERVWTATP